MSNSSDSTPWVWDSDTGKHLYTLESTEIDVSQVDLSNVILTKGLASQYYFETQ